MPTSHLPPPPSGHRPDAPQRPDPWWKVHATVPMLRTGHDSSDKPRPGVPWPKLLIWIAAAVVLVLVLLPFASADERTSLDYTTFLTKAQAGEVATATIDESGRVSGTLVGGEDYRSQIPTVLAGEDLGAQLRAANVTLTGKGPSTSWSSWVLAFAPVLLLVGLLVWLGRRGAAGGALGRMSHAKTQVIDQQRPDVRFDDVAGYQSVKSELGEIIDFLRDPDRFKRLGAKGPRGVLMLGPPGTGKTLFARAIAGEADVPFLSVTGSTFVEMFVGVGAARVRDLFENARRLAPSIVFIDEIDAVGQRRGAQAMLGNDEREQTLNQLLSEMDGFGSIEGVVVLAATNRPDVLDPALLRPGRFDRHITIPLPNRDERRAILGVHCRSKPLGPDVDLDEVARGTPGFSGADLANLANEAAIAAVRGAHDALTRGDFDVARDRIMFGNRDRSSILLPDEKRIVAAHEAGHALVATLTPGTDPVAKVTILPKGPALGVTEQLPVDDRHLYTQSYLDAALTIRMGGRCGELVAIGEVSSGAADDLAGATDLAMRMVREFGMSEALGPIGYAGDRDPLGNGVPLRHDFADATQRLIDAEVARLLGHAHARAEALLRANEPQLRTLIDLLLDAETVDGTEVIRICRAPAPG